MQGKHREHYIEQPDPAGFNRLRRAPGAPTGWPPVRHGLAWLEKGLAELERGAANDAVADLEQALGWQKTNPDAYYYLARALNQAGGGEVARETLRLAFEHFPEMHSEGGAFGLYPPINFAETTPAKKMADPNLGDEIIESLKALMAGIERLDDGDTVGAEALLLAALEANPWNLNAYYFLAAAFAHGGAPEKARLIFAEAINRHPYAYARASRFGEFQGFGLDEKTTIAYYAALADRVGDIGAFLRPCPLTGGRGGALDTAAEDTLRRTYECAMEDWRAGRIPGPARSGAGPTDRGGNDRSLLLVSPRHIKCDQGWVEYDATLHYQRTAGAFFNKFDLHYSDAIDSEGDQLIQPRTDQVLRLGIEALAHHIEDFAPDIVFFSGNFLGGRQGIGWSDLKMLKDRYGFRLAVMVGDIYPPKPNYAKYWSQAADLIVALNEHPYLDEVENECQLLLWPGVTAASDLMAGNRASEARREEVLFLGARKGYRDLWLAHVRDAGIPSNIRFTDQSRENSVSTEEYFRLFGTARLIFNSGMVSSSDHHPNFRIFEAMASGTALIQQDFPLLREYFQPFIHYAPVDTVHQLTVTAKFLLKRTEIAEAMATEAGTWYAAHYAGPQFWQRVSARLQAPASGIENGFVS